MWKNEVVQMHKIVLFVSILYKRYTTTQSTPARCSSGQQTQQTQTAPPQASTLTEPIAPNTSTNRSCFKCGQSRHYANYCPNRAAYTTPSPMKQGHAGRQELALICQPGADQPCRSGRWTWKPRRSTGWRWRSWWRRQWIAGLDYIYIYIRSSICTIQIIL